MTRCDCCNFARYESESLYSPGDKEFITHSEITCDPPMGECPMDSEEEFDGLDYEGQPISEKDKSNA